MTDLAIFGPGRVGTSLARVALAAGHDVTLVGSGDLDETRLIAGVVAPGASADAAAATVSRADLVMLAIPLHRFDSLDAPIFSGKIVIDAMNYWPPVTGMLPQFEGEPSSTVVARRLPGARVVKTLNHIGYHELESDGRPPRSQERRALGVASDDPVAAGFVAVFLDSVGYDAVLLDSLAAGRALEPGTAIFADRFTRVELTAAVRPVVVH